MKHVTIEEMTLPNMWFRVCREILEHGELFEIAIPTGDAQRDEQKVLSSEKFDTLTKKLAVTLIIRMPWEEPLIDSRCGTDRMGVNKYMDYLWRKEKAPHEAYTYGQRIMEDIVPEKGVKINEYQDVILCEGDFIEFDEETGDIVRFKLTNQLQYVINRLKLYPHDRQATIVIRKASDILLKHPPCLIMLDFEIIDGRLVIYIYFRSWDCFAGLPVNLGGLELFKQWLAKEIGVENGEMIAFCKNLHLYGRHRKLVEELPGEVISIIQEQLKGGN